MRIDRFGPLLPLAGAALVAIVFRWFYFAQLSGTPPFLHPVLDAAAHFEWARGFLAGTWPGAEPFFRAPGYPWALAAGLGIVGGSGGLDGGAGALVRAQLFLGVVTPVLTAGLAGRLFGTAAAWVAGIGAALFPILAFFDGQMLAPALAVPLTVAATILTVSAIEEGGSRRALLVGLAWGAAGVVRPPLLLVGVIAAIAVAVAREPGRGTRGRRALAAATIGLLFLPLLVTARNGLAGDAAPIASQGGLNFHLGNGAHANGTAAALREAPTALGYDMMRVAGQMAESREGRTLKPTEVSRHWSRRARAEIAEDPVRWLRLLARKAALVGLDREIPNNHDPAVFAEHVPLLRLPGWIVWFPLGVVGAWLARRRAGPRFVAGAVLAILLAAVLFFVNARFRVPAVPLLIALGAGGAVEIARRLRRHPRSAIIPIAALVTLAIVSRANPYSISRAPWPASYVLVAEAESRRGEPVRALGWLDRALEAQPGLYTAQVGRIDLLRKMGRVAEARAETGRAVAALPGDARLRAEHASLLDLGGDPEGALREIDEAIRLDPGYDPARVHRAVILARLGRPGEAVAALDEFLRTRPASPEGPRARSVLADVEAGRLDPVAE